MVRFSDRSKSIRPTGVRRMFDMAGDDAVQFGLGEPDFQPRNSQSRRSQGR